MRKGNEVVLEFCCGWIWSKWDLVGKDWVSRIILDLGLGPHFIPSLPITCKSRWIFLCLADGSQLMWHLATKGVCSHLGAEYTYTKACEASVSEQETMLRMQDQLKCRRWRGECVLLSLFCGFWFYPAERSGKSWHIQIQREYLPTGISFPFLFPEEKKFANVEKCTVHITFFR